MSKIITASLTETGKIVTFSIKRVLDEDWKVYQVFTDDRPDGENYIGTIHKREKKLWEISSMVCRLWCVTTSRNEAVKLLAQEYMTKVKRTAPEEPEWLPVGPKGKRLPTRFTEMKIEVLNTTSISDHEMQHLRDLIAYAWAVHIRGDALGPAVRLDLRSFKVSADILTTKRTFALEALLDFMESIPGYIREGSPRRSTQGGTRAVDPMPLPFNVELYVK